MSRKMTLYATAIIFIIQAILACNKFSQGDHIQNNHLHEAKNAGFLQGTDEDILQQHEEWRSKKYMTNLSTKSLHQMNVLMVYDLIDPLYKTDSVKYNFLVKMLFPIVRGWINDNLNIYGDGTTTPKSEKCVKATVPKRILSKQLLADQVLIITTSNEPTENTIAWASVCELDGTSFRPVMGQININVAHLNTDFNRVYETFTTVLHEVSHVLAMAPALYSYWIDSNTGQKQGKSNVITLDVYSGKTVIVTPKVKNFARKFFNCIILPGAMTEDEGSLESKGAHWEKRHWGSEIMSDIQVPNAVISELTISMFEDSGWYFFRKNLAANQVKSIDYEPLFWLKNYGCKIYTDECPKTSHSCSNTGDFGCSYDNTFRGVCENVSFANKCNYFVPYTPWEKFDCRVIETSSTGENLYADRYFNSQGPNRRCFNGQINDKKSAYKKTGNFCFKPKCSYNNLTFQYSMRVQFGSKWLECKKDGQKIQIVGDKFGYLTCPKSINKFCEIFEKRCKNDCLGRGRCMQNGQCLCYEGFSGDDCGDRATYKEEYVNGSFQAYISVKEGRCYNGGVYIPKLGYCLCNVGYYDTTCSSSIPGMYYSVPAQSITSGGIMKSNGIIDQTAKSQQTSSNTAIQTFLLLNFVGIL